MSDPDERMVSNPTYDRLVTLKTKVNDNRASMESSLNYANTKMHDESTWTGSTVAPAWAEELSGRKTDLPELMDGVIDAIDERMREVPEEIPPPQTGQNMPI